MLATFLLLDTADSPIGLEDDKKGRRHVLLSLFFPPTHHSLFLGEDCDDIENSNFVFGFSVAPGKRCTAFIYFLGYGSFRAWLGSYLFLSLLPSK